MATIAASPTSGSERELALRRRRDIVAVSQRSGGRSFWVLKDPTALRYFRLRPEEHALWEMIDGQTSLAGLKARFEARFRPKRIKLSEIGQFLSRLHASGLLVSDAPGQGEELFRRADARRRTQRWARWTNPLSIRLPGFQPERLLETVYPFARWFFSPAACIASGMLIASAAALLVVHFDAFQARLPGFRDFLTPSRLVWLMVALVVTKCLHELGHALACRHFGGRCTEMGLLLLMFMPCLYCDVSDSWLLASKWRRAAIAAAGMYVELVLASLCTLLWWASAPGMFHHLCFSVMIVSSVSTLVFNGNPLLRYDGYYILSDLSETPNLGQRASSALATIAGQACLGIESNTGSAASPRREAALALYALAAALYRTFVVLSIIWAMTLLLEPKRLGLVAQLLGASMLFALVGRPLVRLGQYFSVPGRLDLVNKKHFGTTLALAAAVIAVVFVVPLPHRVYGTLELEPFGAAPVYVEVAGSLDEVLVRPGQVVAPDATLLRLANPDVELDIAQLETRRGQYESQLQSLRRRRFQDEAAGLQIPQLERSLEAVIEQLQQKRHDLERLAVIAPKAGTVLPPPRREEPPRRDAELVGWSETPFVPENIGSKLEAGTLVCRIGDPDRLQATLVIDQADIPRIEVGQQVEIQLAALPGRTIRGTVGEIARMDLKVAPRQLSSRGGGELATRTDGAGIERPVETSYQVRVYPLEDAEGLLLAGMRGEAKVRVAASPLGTRAWDWFCRTFRFSG